MTTEAPVPDYVSECGRFRVEYAMSEGPRMSHVIVAPRVHDTRAGRVLLDLWHAATWDFEGTVVGATASTIELVVRRYPGTALCAVVIDADALTYDLRNAVRPARLAPLEERLRLAGLRPAG